MAFQKSSRGPIEELGVVRGPAMWGVLQRPVIHRRVMRHAQVACPRNARFTLCSSKLYHPQKSWRVDQGGFRSARGVYATLWAVRTRGSRGLALQNLAPHRARLGTTVRRNPSLPIGRRTSLPAYRVSARTLVLQYLPSIRFIRHTAKSFRGFLILHTPVIRVQSHSII